MPHSNEYTTNIDKTTKRYESIIFTTAMKKVDSSQRIAFGISRIYFQFQRFNIRIHGILKIVFTYTRTDAAIRRGLFFPLQKTLFEKDNFQFYHTVTPADAR